MKKTKILFLLLLITITASSTLQSQEYIKLLEGSNVWYQSELMEFEGIANYPLLFTDTIYYNEYTYFNLDGFSFLREDTILKTVYFSSSANPEYEKILYDFSLEEGDNIYLEVSDFSNSWYHCDSTKYMLIGGKNRKVIFLAEEQNMGGQLPVWIEGIGSLAGILKSDIESGWHLWLGGVLHCFYQNDELIYQSEIGQMYGCQMEIDPDPPFLEDVWVNNDSVYLDETQQISVIAADMTTLNIEVTIVSPNNNEYIYNNFNEYLDNWYADFITDYNNEMGDWYLSNIRLEDEQNNVTEETYTFENSPGKFYVRNPTAISETVGNPNFNIYPNPVSNILHIETKICNSQEEYLLEIYNIMGEMVYSEILFDNNNKISTKTLPIGVYFINLKSSNKIIYSNKFIKNN